MVQHVRIKMCGMTRAEDIRYATSLGVDAIGLIFYPGSSRHVTLEHARLLLQKIPLFVDVVAVFVNPDYSLVEQVITALPIQYLQFHGDELPEFCTQFSKPYIKAVAADSRESIESLITQHKKAAAILLDTPSTKHRGGTGKTFDWQIIPPQIEQPIILAGGLNTMNVNNAIRSCSLNGIDVCSGIEVSPGIKDPVKMKQFVNAVWRKG